MPDAFALHQNYPNPFNPVTTLRYDLPEHAFVNITIYDMGGRVIKTLVSGQQSPDMVKFIQSVSAGVYVITKNKKSSV